LKSNSCNKHLKPGARGEKKNPGKYRSKRKGRTSSTLIKRRKEGRYDASADSRAKGENLTRGITKGHRGEKGRIRPVRREGGIPAGLSQWYFVREKEKRFQMPQDFEKNRRVAIGGKRTRSRSLIEDLRNHQFSEIKAGRVAPSIH